MNDYYKINIKRTIQTILEKLGMLVFAFTIILFSITANSQNIISDTLTFNKDQAHKRFIESNFVLLAEKLNIDIAQASIRQARIWENPSFEIEEVNFWATEHQLSLGDELPPFFGDSFGKNRQVAIQLEQLFLIAGKRNKLIDIKEVDKKITEEYFDLLTLSLKRELDDKIAELIFLQEKLSVFKKQLEKSNLVTNAAKNWYQNNDIPKIEYYRLKSLNNELYVETAEIHKEIFDLQADLRTLLAIPYGNYIVIEPDEDINNKLNELLLENFDNILARVLNNNPEVKISNLNTEYYNKLLVYERAKRYPDLAFNVGYARENFLLDFIGFGLSLDLPIFDRNQAQIQIAEIEINKSEYLRQNTIKSIENNTLSAWQKMLKAKDIYEKIDKDIIDDFETLMIKMNEYYADRTVSMLEYLDFFEAYRDINLMYFQARKNLEKSYNKIRYLVGI